jgi:uncharacterized membrane protein
MKSKATILGHPVHMALVGLPVGLLLGAVIFDVASIISGSAWMALTACAMIPAGIACGLVAAPFGLIDYLAIPGNTRAKSVGLVHGLGNVVVLGLFALSWMFRRDNPAMPDPLAQLFSFSGGALLILTGWLGGELVSRLGVGVDSAG